MAHNGILLRITGKVQGVGFRPTVWQVANRLGLEGDVGNNADGVEVRLWGTDADSFITQLRRHCPALARIDAIETQPWNWPRRPSSFTIIASRDGQMHTQVVPDAATCDACLAELSDPANRRYRYPFINCTHCGPRFTLIRRMPYDRPNTAMADFPLCPDCLAEYQDPADRRFHAQPNACPVCGPSVWLADERGRRLAEKDDAITEAARRLCAGEIIAVKGLGGFHLACDATSAAAVARLRARKHRPSKPLAVMMPDGEALRRFTGHDDAALAALLQSPAAPIVLVPRRAGAFSVLPAEGAASSVHALPFNGAFDGHPAIGNAYGQRHDTPPDAQAVLTLSDTIAPGLHEIGVMLPANPLQHLLLARVGRPLVMTSGNVNGRPPALTNAQALQDLARIADGWLLHDRDIVQRADDSLVRWTGAGVETLRRSRGFVPDAIALPPGFAHAGPVLAMGGDLKNTFCLLRDGQAVLSQHLGDLADEGIQRQQREALALFSAIWNFTPGMVAVDAHPGYISRRLGEALARERAIPCHTISHHHAHLAACLGEHGWPRDGGPVIGLALDGLGYGGPRRITSADLAPVRADASPEHLNASPKKSDALSEHAGGAYLARSATATPACEGPLDNVLWGGECLKVDYRDCEWQGGLPAVALPGGDKAARQPWRNLLAQWLHFTPGWEDLPEAANIPTEAGELVTKAVMRGINAPPASSTGRLFDAVAAALGICVAETSWEGEAACRLEALAWRAAGSAPLLEDIPVTAPIAGNVVDLATFWRQWLSWRAAPAMRAYAFHLALARGFATLARRAAADHGINTIALSGGVLHNRLFRGLLIRELRGLRVLTPATLPAGDGGLALGQALIAAARIGK